MGPPRYGHPESGDNPDPYRLRVGLMPLLVRSETRVSRRPLAGIFDGLDDKYGKQRHVVLCAVEFYGQAERAISNGKLNPLLGLHIRPIKQVVFLCPS